MATDKSPKIEAYFKELEEGTVACYAIATEARKKGYDPLPNVEMPLAKNMAERVVGLIGTAAPQIKDTTIVQRIQELEGQYGAQDWRVALQISSEVAQQKFCTFKDVKEAMEIGIRIGIAYITVGVVASPLEGFVKLELKIRQDGKEYMALYYSGPIRSAGGTAGAVSVVIADHVRKTMGYSEYDPTELEIKRVCREIHDYHDRITNLQYHPSDEELEYLVGHLPVQITGDPSEKIEVSNYKDVPRIETNRLRNGVALIIAECLCGKAPKVFKKLNTWGKDFGLEHWSWLGDFADLQKKIKARSKTEESNTAKLMPDYTFIKDLVAGRPILTHPLAPGGFRLRYGRARTSGFSTDSIHPATMYALHKYIAIGTQLKVERPGKSTVISACDTIEGPIIKTHNGDVIRLETIEDARKYVGIIDEIIYLGDILICYGDFLDRAHKLIPCGYNEEWHVQEIKKKKSTHPLMKKLEQDRFTKITAQEAIILSKEFGIPLHPRYTYHWNSITSDHLESLKHWYLKGIYQEEEQKIILPFVYDLTTDVDDKDPKRALELLGVPHKVIAKEHVIITGDDADSLHFIMNALSEQTINTEKSSLENINEHSGIIIRDKSGTTIGARMGRPEKAKIRKLTGSPQGLFPVGEEGGKMRNLQESLKKGKVTSDFPLLYCETCRLETIYLRCENCNQETSQNYYYPATAEIKKTPPEEGERAYSHSTRSIDVNHYFKKALNILELREYPDMIKGVRGMGNDSHVTEHLTKAILRSKHELYVNKEGTIRYDMIEMPITHFKQREIGTSIERLKELGYTHDVNGKELENQNQIIELKCQDIILPACKDNLEEGSDTTLVRVTQFIDELLEKLYKLPAYYKITKPEQLAGHLVVAMSPHTSAGIVGRIIGFSKTQGFLTHPLYHSIMRRDCDGDEACVILLLDALVNFSRKYLPSHRGVTQDAPLVLTYNLIPKEVDDMVFNMDIAAEYPLELYEAAQEYKNPWDVDVKTFGKTIDTPEQYEGLWFTHDTTDLNEGVTCSAYKSIPSMAEKVRGQMLIAEQLRAVDESDVARLIIERHFMRDIKGNLRKFGMQEFRCVECNSKYRRPPLVGVCTECGGRLLFTIAEGSIVKYLAPSLELAEKYSLPPYLKQVLEITQKRIESVFGKDEEKQEGLKKWF